jgi:hypothetical protein
MMTGRIFQETRWDEEEMVREGNFSGPEDS